MSHKLYSPDPRIALATVFVKGVPARDGVGCAWWSVLDGKQHCESDRIDTEDMTEEEAELYAAYMALSSVLQLPVERARRRMIVLQSSCPSCAG